MHFLAKVLFLGVVGLSVAARGEWYESYKEDLRPNHVPVGPLILPKYRGSRGEWHLFYRTPETRPDLLSRIQQGVMGWNKVFHGLSKRDTSREQEYYPYGSYDQYSSEYYQNFPAESQEAEEEAQPFGQRIYKSFENLMTRVRSFLIPGSVDQSIETEKKTVERESEDGFPKFEQDFYPTTTPAAEPSFFERIRLGINTMMRRATNFFQGSSEEEYDYSTGSGEETFASSSSSFEQPNQSFDPAHPNGVSERHRQRFAHRHPRPKVYEDGFSSPPHYYNHVEDPHHLNYNTAPKETFFDRDKQGFLGNTGRSGEEESLSSHLRPQYDPSYNGQSYEYTAQGGVSPSVS